MVVVVVVVLVMVVVVVVVVVRVKMLTGELKSILIEKINAFLKIHQENREKAKSKLDEFLYKNQ